MSEHASGVSAAAIRALDDRTIERIAAGEVVERPASVVKELVENSLDADASRIEVVVTDSGRELIRVIDDGVGIAPDAIEKAVKQHTTSKLPNVDALEHGIETLGFRGEALYTIAAVSKLTVSSRPRGDAAGVALRIHGGDVLERQPAGRPPGTTVEVRELFYNTPARRAFLRAPETEFDHISRVVTNYALANPDVAISLTHDDRAIFSTTGEGDLRAAMLAMYGRDVAEGMIDIDVDVEDGPIEHLAGAIGTPEQTRSRPRYMSTFVNGRYIESPLLRNAIIDAYGTELSPERYPFAVIFCAVPPERVDVNVHPRKMEVRFSDEAAVAEAVEQAIADTLRSAGIIRSTAPRGRGMPAETPVHGEESTLEAHSEQPASSLARRSVPNRSTGEMHRGNTPTDRAPRSVHANSAQQGLTGSVPDPDVSSLPSLRILGQLADTFIVAEGPNGLVLIDQHAADERINFERLRRAFRSNPGQQRLLEPVPIELTADEAEAADILREALGELGFSLEAGGNRTIEVSTVPAVFDTTVAPERVRDAIGSALEAADPSAPIDAVADAILGDLACYPAVTGHTPLAAGPIIELLEALDACENPYACPHGRPVLIEIDYRELEDRFERDYPGHSGRRREDVRDG